MRGPARYGVARRGTARQCKANSIQGATYAQSKEEGREGGIVH